MRVFVTGAVLLLTSCAPEGTAATYVCENRDTVSGICLTGKYVCPAPMALLSDPGHRARCYMPNLK